MPAASRAPEMCPRPLARSGTSIAAAYDRWAATYDHDHNRTRVMAGEALRAAELPVADARLIEVGCGTGLNTGWLAERAQEVVALDFSPEMLARARQRVAAPQVRFVEHDVTHPWPVADAAADLVVVMLVLEHVAEVAAVFAEAARALAPGGTLWLCELHPLRQLLGRQAVITDPATGAREPIDAFLHDASELVNSGLAAGLTLVQLDERRDPSSSRPLLPRLLAARFRRP